MRNLTGKPPLWNRFTGMVPRGPPRMGAIEILLSVMFPIFVGAGMSLAVK